MILAGLLAIGAAIVLAVLALAGRGTKDRKAVLDLVVAHGPTGVLGGGAEGSAAAPQPAARSGLSDALVGLARRIAARGTLAARLTGRLERAGSTWKVEEWLLLCAGAAVAGAVVLTLLLGPIGVVLGPVVGLLGPHLYLSRAASKRRARFTNDLPDALQLVASGLASGYSLPQAFNAVVSLGEGPVPAEIGRALAQARLGTSVEDALQAAAQRVGSVDLDWVVMAIRIQRQVGGSLADVLLQVAGTIRERGWLRRHVTALAAEGKLSGYILGGMPVGIAAFLSISQPEYLAPFFAEPLGLALLAVGVVMLSVGGFWMRSTVQIDL